MGAPALRRPVISPAFVLFAVFLLLLLPNSARAIYCGEDDCYDLLGVTQSANTSEIKKAYYKLSLKYHPDKNSDPESKKLFVNIANAYEILKDEATREQYDYAIAHPEEVPANRLCSLFDIFNLLLLIIVLIYAGCWRAKGS